MKRLSTILLVLAFFIVGFPVSAAVFHSGEEFTLPQSEVVSDDLYIAGSSITTVGEIQGDVIAVGGKVLLNGTVAEDVTAAGGSVDVLSNVGDDVRVAGGQVVIGGSVAGDLISFGGQVQVLSDASVGGDMIVGAARVVIDGDVEGSLRAYGNDVQINGNVSGNLEVFADSAFSLGKDVHISGDLSYRAPEEITLSPGMVDGEVVFEEHSVRFDRSLLNAVMGAAFTLKLLMLLVAGLLAVVFFSSLTHDVSSYAVEHFGKSLLIGFVFVVVVPVGSFLLLLSIIGAAVAAIFMLLYALALVVAKVLAGILTGALISRFVRKEVITDWRFALFGIVVIQLVSLVPIIGWILSFVITLAALGALAFFSYQRFWIER